MFSKLDEFKSATWYSVQSWYSVGDVLRAILALDHQAVVRSWPILKKPHSDKQDFTGPIVDSMGEPAPEGVRLPLSELDR